MTPIDRHALAESLRPELAGATTVYVTGEDHLRVRSHNGLAGVALAIDGRFLDASGRITPFVDRHVPNSDRTEASSVISLGEGFLTNVSVRVTAGAPKRGQCFVRLEVVRGRTGAFQSLACLLADYVTVPGRAVWPGGRVIESTEGPGAIRSLTGTDPAANVELLETVPTGARWRVLSLDVALVTDATAANREVVLTIDDGAAIVAEVASGTNHVASTTRRYSFTRNVQRGAGATALTINAPMPDLWLPAGARLSTVTTNRQIGDNFGAPQLLVEEWIEP